MQITNFSMVFCAFHRLSIWFLNSHKEKMKEDSQDAIWPIEFVAQKKPK